MTGRAKIEGASEKRVGRDDGRETPEKSALVFEVLYSVPATPLRWPDERASPQDFAAERGLSSSARTARE